MLISIEKLHKKKNPFYFYRAGEYLFEDEYVNKRLLFEHRPECFLRKNAKNDREFIRSIIPKSISNRPGPIVRSSQRVELERVIFFSRRFMSLAPWNPRARRSKGSGQDNKKYPHPIPPSRQPVTFTGNELPKTVRQRFAYNLYI